jgi:diguanylate cyclase (GGDEF)-like protein
VARAQGYKSLICLPLASHARLLGVIYFYRTDRDRFLPDEIDILLTFAHLAAGVLENAHLYAWMSEQAARDMLTGLYNRRTFEQRLREETQRAARYGKPYSLMLLDIDRFKDVNDTYGHPAGDTVLRALADLLRDKARDIDTVARYGGEEFAVIMPETDGQTALRVANRLRADIGALSIELAAEQAIRATVSIGVACFPHCADDAPSLVEHADQALYVAKHSGRNRASLYGDMLKTELEQNPGRMLDLLHQDLRNVNAIAVASDAKAESHHNHTQHVVDYAVRLGTSLGLDRVGLEILTYAAQLHDAGLMSVPDAVFRKSGPLTEMEWEWVRRHPVVMADILDQVPALAAVAPVVRHHHERYDGSGYPAGLKGEAIPYLARVLAVADAYAALIAHRPYRRARSPQEVCDMFEGMAGKAFDPAVVRVFVGLIRAELR